MSIAQKALWIIERNSARELTLPAIAEACGVSRSHLANAFAAATGHSVMRYLRGRRLSEAAHALAAGADDILPVALDAGYSSHEAFTRAFKDQFGVTPETVRDRRSLHGLTLVEPIEAPRLPRTRPAPPEIVRAPEIRAVGRSERVSYETTVRIPALWQRFVPYMEGVAFAREAMPISIVHPVDDAGAFAYVCALEVTRFGDTDPDLVEITLPARDYATFQHTGHVSTLDDTYLAIWNDLLPALGLALADAPLIERHNEAFDPDTGEGGLVIWAPVEM